jgi:hypothetical protein
MMEYWVDSRIHLIENADLFLKGMFQLVPVG